MKGYHPLYSRITGSNNILPKGGRIMNIHREKGFFEINEKIDEAIKELENGLRLAEDRKKKKRYLVSNGYMMIAIDNAIRILKEFKEESQ